MQRVRLRYTKRGRLRFTSHRDIARVFERALRRAKVPMAFSAGFSPHPRISWVGAAATGVASEAEYVEIALAAVCDPEQLRIALDAALPDGIDCVEAVVATPGSSLPDLVQASRWSIRLPEVPLEQAQHAVAVFLAAESVEVERMTKNGRRAFDARAAVISMSVDRTAAAAEAPATPVGVSIAMAPSHLGSCAILTMVVQHVTPAVRPDDVLTGLRSVGGLATPVPPAATRLAQGPLTATREVADPFAPDRVAAGTPGAPVTGATRQVDEVAGAPLPI